MGFKKPKRRADVKILEGDYAGLEMGLSLSVSLDDFINFQRLRFGDDVTLDTQVEAFNWFADNVLLDWNLEEDDSTPIPVSRAAFGSLEPALLLTIISKWREAVTEVELPLGNPSTNGKVSVTSTTTRPGVISRSPRRSSRRQ